MEKLHIEIARLAFELEDWQKVITVLEPFKERKNYPIVRDYAIAVDHTRTTKKAMTSDWPKKFCIQLLNKHPTVIHALCSLAVPSGILTNSESEKILSNRVRDCTRRSLPAELLS